MRSTASLLLMGAAVFALLSVNACAQDRTPLIDHINAYRSAPAKCAGRTVEGVGPLAPSQALANVKLDSKQSALGDAIKATGYAAARSQAIVLSGPGSTEAVMGMLRERYCEALLNPEFSEIGIARDGRTWRIVLARPLISNDLGGWAYAGKQVLTLVNEARSRPRICGNQRYGAAPPLEWDAKLASTALAHSGDMAKRNYFAHKAPDGSMVGERAARAGYDWSRIGENIAAGQGSAEQVVAGWLASPEHCANLMREEFTQMGAAYVINAASTTGIYWTQVFGRPR